MIQILLCYISCSVYEDFDAQNLIVWPCSVVDGTNTFANNLPKSLRDDCVQDVTNVYVHNTFYLNVFCDQSFEILS
jgi:hypothetical protein